jgi:hypothetical protein
MFSVFSRGQSIWLAGLLILWAVLLLGGFLLGKPGEPGAARMPVWTRLLSSFVLVIAAWAWYVVARQTGGRTSALLIAIGMSLGFLGDLFMARVLPAPDRVIAGILSFGLGHVAYIAAGMSVWRTFEPGSAGPFIAAWLAWLLIGAAAWYVVVYRGPSIWYLFVRRSVPGNPLAWAALPYALLLASTAGVATGLALQSVAFLPFAFGAALFLVSDLILASQLFTGRSFPFIGDVIWLTYGPGQMFIVYSVSAVMR